jgi:hypothetical protein
MDRSVFPPRAALAAALMLLLAPALAAAQVAPDAPRTGPMLDLRYRTEVVDDAAFARDAVADTLRLRLGFRWVLAPGWQLYADGEHVEPLFGEHYNSTANGRTQYPVVADPGSTEINQAWIGYAGPTLGATLGRQRLLLDNQRFFGNSGWRQNEQTFDAFTSRYAFGGGGPTVRYAFLDRVLRVNGHDNPDPLLRAWDLRGHLLNIAQAVPAGQLTGYGYWVANEDIATLSTRTLGARWTGRQAFEPLAVGWAVELAQQSDWSNNPVHQAARYRLVEPMLEWKGVVFKAGWEVLGGDGRYGFQTPYATLHAFNGWADRFTTTPKDGLDDRYLGASGSFGHGFSWAGTWHDFRADRGGRAYGSELDASLGYAFDAHWNALVKLADYRSDGFASDERKLWASIEYHY